MYDFDEFAVPEEYQEIPWYTGRGVDEDRFCREFLRTHRLVCEKGCFYGEDGAITDESIIRKDIYEMLCQYVRTGLAKKVDALMAALRLAARGELPEEEEEVIHVANGTYHLLNGFSPFKQICRHRLPVRYSGKSSPAPTWEHFLSQLLEPQDILTLQEFMGYCLLPTNRAQRMLMILGRGGEGKSRIGVVLKAILGSAMNIASLSKIESSPFARADLERLLVMVDDDLRLEALKSTNYIKSIISADLPMDVERKGIQSYQSTIYARFLAFGNGSLQALHDRSYGFFRRQIILQAKPVPPGRVDDPYLGDKLAKEAEQIFIWCLKGLYRLVENDYRFTLSSQALDNWSEAVASQINLVDFMGTPGYFRYDPDGCITTRRFYELYQRWCDDNALKPLSAKTFSSYLISNAHSFGLTYTNRVPIEDGKMARGFQGVIPDVGLRV